MSTATSIARRVFQQHCAGCSECSSLVKLCDKGLSLYRVCRDEARAELLKIKGAPSRDATGAP